jgi:hypothetical protein
MKSFDDVREPSTQPEFLEEGLLRKGGGVLYARQAKNKGDSSSQHFKSAQSSLNRNAGASVEDQIRGLSNAIDELSKGLIEQRHQLGALTSLALITVLFNEKGNRR